MPKKKKYRPEPKIIHPTWDEEQEQEIAQQVADKLNPTIVWIGGKMFTVTSTQRQEGYTMKLCCEPVPDKDELDIISKQVSFL